ncbi:ABC transporter permease, partial [Streptomyces gardneri]|uniref:ABC transporter permease n=1 Tax=Streptomyces gardneri TaxID=66892 RepID=UPI00369A50DC
MALGSSIGVACLAAVLTIPSILTAHDARTAAREPRPGASNVVYREFRDPYGSQPLHRVFVARTNPGSTPLPPGISKLPEAGDAIVSPKLAEILAANPRAAGLVPGRVTDIIAPEGLGDSDDLYAYIGTTPAQLIGAETLGGFGIGRSWRQIVDPSTLDILRFTLGCIVLLPLVTFLSVCARLSGESRARRLAALRLVGLSVKDTLRVNAGESVIAAFVGALLGVVEYLGVNEVMARIGLPGLHWYPADGRLDGFTLAVCLLGCPAIAWGVGQFSARRAALSPISVRRTGEPRPASKYGALLLIPGLGIIGGYCMLSAIGRDPSGGSANAVLVPGAVLLTGAGLVLGLTPITAWLARRIASTAKSLPLALAMRRTEVDPGSSLRVATGLLLLVFGTSLTQGVLIELNQVSRRTDPVQEYSLPMAELTTQQRTELTELSDVDAHGYAVESWVRNLEEDRPRIRGVVATCAQLASFTQAAHGCIDNKVLRIESPAFLTDEDARPGSNFKFLLSNGRKLDVAVPQDALTVRGYQPSEFVGPSLLIPPSLVPEGVELADARLVLVSDAAPATIRAVLDGIGAIAPTAAVDPVGIVIDSLAQLTVIRSLLAVGMVLGLVIGVA